jgi:hypothetical protein
VTAAKNRPAKPTGYFREPAPAPDPMTFRPPCDTDDVVARIDAALEAWENTKGWERYKAALYAQGAAA